MADFKSLILIRVAKTLLQAIIFFSFLIAPSGLFAQHYHGFPFGKVTSEELSLRVYPKDTAATALVLDEFGEAYIDNGGENNLLLEYHVKIKILKTAGLGEADFRILLRKNKSQKEYIRSVEGITYNVVNGAVRQSVLGSRDVFTTSLNQYRDECKFAMPDVQVGSVIEVRYVLESPYVFNFYPWRFQSHIPKVRSEFWARIPGNYVYNISLRGFLQLSKNESSIVANCFTPGGGNSADCALYKYKIEDIPALVEEDYMLAASNFLAGIDYELSEIKRFNGTTIRYTKTWKDAIRELNTDDNFGSQIRKARSVWEQPVAVAVMNKSDNREKATAVYDLIKGWFLWNEFYGIYTDQGVKKAYDTRKGNVADINLSLVAALQQAGLQAEPVILATRQAGLPNQLYPVISDFNYVVASVVLDDEYYMLDATAPLLPFGLLPRRCLNGTGRLVPRKDEDSRWIDLKPREKDKQMITLYLKLADNGLTGEMAVTSYGYGALDKRSELIRAGSVDKYKEKLEHESNEFEILDYAVDNSLDLSKPVQEKFKVAYSLDESNPSLLYFNPFLIERWTNNPFKTNERLYPVDFGAPLETTFVIVLEYPQDYEVDELPSNVALALPQGGGKLLYNVSNISNKVSVTCVINISKSIYSSTEYHTLKELFNRILNVQQSHIVLKRK